MKQMDDIKLHINSCLQHDKERKSGPCTSNDGKMEAYVCGTIVNAEQIKRIETRQKTKRGVNKSKEAKKKRERWVYGKNEKEK